MKFTNEQIKRWKAYEKVRASGIDPRARRAALLSEEDFTFVIKTIQGRSPTLRQRWRLV